MNTVYVTFSIVLGGAISVVLGTEYRHRRSLAFFKVYLVRYLGNKTHELKAETIASIYKQLPRERRRLLQRHSNFKTYRTWKRMSKLRREHLELFLEREPEIDLMLKLNKAMVFKPFDFRA